MQRCASTLLAFGLIAVSACATAQVQRNFPANALRGEMTIVQPPEVLLNDKPARLAPGSRIRGGDNLLQMSGALIGQKFAVHYTIDDLGLVKDVWLLRADELARKPWPRTPAEASQWAFDPVAQTWTKP